LKTLLAQHNIETVVGEGYLSGTGEVPVNSGLQPRDIEHRLVHVQPTNLAPDAADGGDALCDESGAACNIEYAVSSFALRISDKLVSIRGHKRMKEVRIRLWCVTKKLVSAHGISSPDYNR
jgi:hypothetical protein